MKHPSTSPTWITQYYSQLAVETTCIKHTAATHKTQTSGLSGRSGWRAAAFWIPAAEGYIGGDVSIRGRQQARQTVGKTEGQSVRQPPISQSGSPVSTLPPRSDSLRQGRQKAAVTQLSRVGLPRAWGLSEGIRFHFIRPAQCLNL